MNEALNEIKKITVVIPTLGGDVILKTIEKLNNGSIVPSEILICIPEAYAHMVEKINDENVSIIKTSMKGQVAQRALGFRYAKHPLVLQLDDDIQLYNDALKELSSALFRLGKGNVVAPVYYDTDTCRCLHELPTGLKGILKSLYAYIICGAPWGRNRMGSLTSLGLGYGVDSACCSHSKYLAEWLPGGCVLSYRDDLITDNYYPFSGKAYSEDIINSILRSERDIKHYVIPTSSCNTESNLPLLAATSLSDEKKVREYVVEKLGGRNWRLGLWLGLEYIKRVIA